MMTRRATAVTIIAIRSSLLLLLLLLSEGGLNLETASAFAWSLSMIPPRRNNKFIQCALSKNNALIQLLDPPLTSVTIGGHDRIEDVELNSKDSSDDNDKVVVVENGEQNIPKSIDEQMITSSRIIDNNNLVESTSILTTTTSSSPFASRSFDPITGLPKPQQQTSSRRSSIPQSQHRLSKAHQSLMARSSSMRRQRFVTGRYPLTVSVVRNPTRRWMGLAESHVYLNGTSIEKSLASYDAFLWHEDDERRELHTDYEFLSLELLAEIRVKRPGYVNILPTGGVGTSFQTMGNTIDAHHGGGAFGRTWQSWKMRSSSNSNSNNAASPSMSNIKDDETHVVGNTKERLWVTGFSLTNQRGELYALDVGSGVMSNANDRTARAIKWPNEVTSVPKHLYVNHHHNTDDTGSVQEEEVELEDALLVTDGFLVPGKDKGGLYVVRNPGNGISEWSDCLTGTTNLRGAPIDADGEKSGDWFYHKAMWMDLTGDGRQSILSARAKVAPLRNNNNNIHDESRGGGNTFGRGQLVWLECPRPHSFAPGSQTPLDVDGTVFDPFSSRNTPWKLRVLDEGPDVMFSVADLDPSDDTIEVIASQFFSRKITLHSLRIGLEPKIVFRRTIDDRFGAAFSSVLADLDGLAAYTSKRPGAQNQPTVIDSGSTVISLTKGDAFSHLLVTSHECSFAEKGSEMADMSASDYATIPSGATTDKSKTTDGGSLFAYRIPIGRVDAWKTIPWTRSVVATGFKVEGHISNMINPGAPGFCYTFFPTREGGNVVGKDKMWHRPLIGLSGDCAQSAYILRPVEVGGSDDNSGNSSSGGVNDGIDKSTEYSLMCEIKCQSTVGSLAIGYDDLYTDNDTSYDQQSGYAKIYVPCYEQDKVLVFSMGSDENFQSKDDGW